MTDRHSNPQPGASCCSTASAPSLRPTGGETGKTLAGIVEDLAALRGLPLSFRYGGVTTKPGYHITEFKAARVTGLDCGANVETWSETVLQIWDISESVTGESMTVDKLLGIARKAIASVGAEPASRVVFEVSDGDDAIRVYAFDRVDREGGVAVIHLASRVSACKPLVRGILNVPAACGPKTVGSGVPISRPKGTTQCCG